MPTGLQLPNSGYDAIPTTSFVYDTSVFGAEHFGHCDHVKDGNLARSDADARSLALFQECGEQLLTIGLA